MDGILKCAIQIKIIEQYFLVALFIFQSDLTKFYCVKLRRLRITVNIVDKVKRRGL